TTNHPSAMQPHQAPAACALPLFLPTPIYIKTPLFVSPQTTLPPDGGSGKTTPPPYPQVPLIDLKTANRLWVHPNPAKEQTIVSLPAFLFEENTFLQVFDVNGKLLYHVAIDKGQTTVLLDTEKWENGLYLLSLRSNNVRLAQAKLIIQH
ncbi:MAG TPA: T9SS type A sorting domain-containing protein, partial [Chitinophagales bacterium]|nr:T9SS type A sorting domain-containing protein [Chitinophagales bacterium]